MNSKWLRIFIYYTIAIVLSNLFRFNIFSWYENLYLPFGLTVTIKALLEGIGPFAAAITIFVLFKRKSSITLMGTSRRKSLIMLVIPIILFTVFGAGNAPDINPHLYGFIIGVSLVAYGIFEEFGWRGYLHDELINLKPLHHSLIIGMLWYAWHLSFLSEGTTIMNEAKFLAIIIFASWGIGQIAEKTKSVIASACFHILGNILFTSSMISGSFDSNTRLIIFGVCLTAWIYLVNVWDKKALLPAWASSSKV